MVKTQKYFNEQLVIELNPSCVDSNRGGNEGSILTWGRKGQGEGLL